MAIKNGLAADDEMGQALAGSHEIRIQHVEQSVAHLGEGLARTETKVDSIAGLMSSMDKKLDIAASVSTDVALLKSKDETKKAKNLNMNLAFWTAVLGIGADLILRFIEHGSKLIK